jgi:3-oxoacyl-[acyl-carrier-protein] synthase II
MDPGKTMSARDVWITGIGLLTSFGGGNACHNQMLLNGYENIRVDASSYAPYPVHSLPEVDFSAQIPKKSDLRQMELWQRIGVYAAGLALADSGLSQDLDLLRKVNLIVAAGSGERDTSVDSRMLESIQNSAESEVLAKEILPTALRPTLFLAQLSNLLAGNISIVHNVTASSRTFMGEEIAGLSSIENGYRRIAGGQGDVFLVGGALNASREDLLLSYELGKNLWPHPYKPVWSRKGLDGGFIPGSVGAFLVLEASEHAIARGRKPYAGLTQVVTGFGQRTSGKLTSNLLDMFSHMNLSDGPLAVMSGASGVEPVTTDELTFLQGLEVRGHQVAIRAFGSLVGHAVEAQFPLGVALAALALAGGEFPVPSDENWVEAPFEGETLSQILVTGVGHWRGEGMALLERVC